MTWLLRLYPAPWRRRYGDEVAGIIANRRFSFRLAVDLVAGAIDVWLHPSVTLAAASAAEPHTKEKTMLSSLARFDCTGALGPDVTPADRLKANIVTLGGTLVLTLIWMAAHVRAGDNLYLDSVSAMAFVVPLLFSLRYTTLKHRPVSVQAIFIGGFSILLTAFLLAAGWVAGRL
jgi:hypothetical protein